MHIFLLRDEKCLLFLAIVSYFAGVIKYDI